MTTSNASSSTRKRLLAAAASLAIAGAIGLGAVTSVTVPVFAEAVRVDAPQAPGFADVVEKVSPAVVSVRVKSRVEPASDNNPGSLFEGPGGMFGGPGFDQLPDDHPLKRFFREKDRIRLQPANPNYPPQFYPSVRIQGKLIGVIRRLD